MTPAQALLAALAAPALMLAVLAGWRDTRRRRRSDPDAVGWIDWTMLQWLSFVALAVLGLLALHG